eukprot:CAMPEP_0196586902 /NCGR_PEP_ID=MMETSP1081-20130531/55878_1 /TAXON_ID=36882 /ORGANISM="Pyramimonas amylifera, Strain CCMP720" /LENGTH=366 /DNA_ID=CAMNT_0041908925 /DNA_START=288 /DNA_END=1388 /DNA_ORIENTATION=-
MTESAADVKRVFNFSAGPAMLPVDVLEEAQADMLDWNGSGMSVMEMSHRGKEFLSIANKAEADLRSLLNIPETYKVLFVQGGASSQFSAIPLNLLTSEETIDVVVTGSWSKKAAAEMKKYCKVNVCAKPDSFTSIPPVAEWSLSPESKYVYFCANETIEGVEFKEDPLCEGKTLIADVSSNFLSKPINVENYGIVYGGVQKNIGPAGMAIVIVKESLLGSARADCPAMMDYKIAADNDSMYNTPPCWTMYMCGLVFAKLLREGGLEGMQERNQEKCKLVYDAIGDSNSFYNCPVDPAVQSCMNIPFTLADAELDKPFISEAAEQGLVTLKGHRSVGGMRASVYNAMPKEGCQKLADFMKDFQAKHA